MRKYAFYGNCICVWLLSVSSLFLGSFVTSLSSDSYLSSSSSSTFSPIYFLFLSISFLSLLSNSISFVVSGKLFIKSLAWRSSKPKPLCNIMAKPTLVTFTCSSDQSTSAYSSTNIHRPALRRRRSQKYSSIAPSASILSFLATIASSDTTHASPTPPTFLCPSIQDIDHHIPLPQPQRRDTPIKNSIDASSSDSTNSARVIRRVPERYERGDDGVWRKVPTYTLYGYTMGCIDGVRPFVLFHAAITVAHHLLFDFFIITNRHVQVLLIQHSTTRFKLETRPQILPLSLNLYQTPQIYQVVGCS